MSVAEAVPATPGWSAGLHLGFRAAPGKTVLAERRRHGPLAVQRPFYPEGDVCHVYLLHPPGGVVGGDRLHIDSVSAAGSSALLTTPGATKFYRSSGPLAQQHQSLQVDDGASLEWLPQENIFFPGARAALRTTIHLRGDARLAWWEVLCLGRPVIGEAFEQGSLDAALAIRRDGVPLLLERLRIDSRSRLRRSLLDGAPVFATAVFSHAAAAQVEQLREQVAGAAGPSAGVTLLEDLLVVRYIGDSTEQARRLFVDAWKTLRGPLLQRPASVPRIWNT
jgi:urease accessory protein